MHLKKKKKEYPLSAMPTSPRNAETPERVLRASMGEKSSQFSQSYPSDNLLLAL
jgi:hypothetical protein